LRRVLSALICIALMVLASASLSASELERPLQTAPAARNPQIRELVSKHADLLGIDAHLVRAVIRIESDFDPRAVSPKGAMGLMQLMPETASLMGVSDPFDIEQNIIGGIRYLQYCLNRFHGDLNKALAAYNAGPLQVEKYDGCPPFAETRNYVAQVMQAYTGSPAPLGFEPAWSPLRPTRLTPAALEIIKELYPYRYRNTKQVLAEFTSKPAHKKKTAMSQEATAVLRELYPYRYSRVKNTGRAGL